MADELSSLINLDLVNQIYKTINAQIREKVYNPVYYSEATLGDADHYYPSGYIAALIVNTLNGLTLTSKTNGCEISGGGNVRLTLDNNLKVTSALTVGDTTNPGAVTIKSRGTGATTIAGPSDGTAALVAGTYTNSATTANATIAEVNTLVKRDESGGITAEKVTGTQACFTDVTDANSARDAGAVVITGGLSVGKNIYAGAVHNAVWNDLVDAMEVPEDARLQYGYCYTWNNGKVEKTSKSSKNCIGIHSNTAGFIMGEKQTKTIKAAVAGFVLAYTDKLYPEGTPLTWGDDGKLIKCGLLKRILHPERIVATFYKEEKRNEWHGLAVSKRHWVKIR